MSLRVPLLAAVAALVATVVTAAPASATSYRYWTYWHGQGSSWVFSSYGPAARPPDGAVEGWRFEVSGATGSSQPPRATPSFDQICATTPAEADHKRVALVVDFGTVDSRPPGQVPPRTLDTFCASVPTSATGYQVLRQYAAFTTDSSGLLCSIAGYPAGECGAVVTTPSPSPSSRPSAQPSASRTAPTVRPATPTTGTTSAAPSPRTTPSSASPRPSTPASTSPPSDQPSAVAVGPGGLPPSTGQGTTKGSSGGLPLGAAAGGLLVVALAVAGVLRARRSP